MAERSRVIVIAFSLEPSCLISSDRLLASFFSVYSPTESPVEPQASVQHASRPGSTQEPLFWMQARLDAEERAVCLGC